jgi:hypothetical protein
MIGLEGSKIKATIISKGIPEVVLAKPHGVCKGMALNSHFLVA